MGDVDPEGGCGGRRRSVDLDLVEGEFAEGLALGDVSHGDDLGDVRVDARQLSLGDLIGSVVELKLELVAVVT
ncbi:hypothetical protein [Asanoa iriomotensis]|uniref:hypothetical protein n=1 Tax=Asanoa iriomotensis TaxID=234613 RepID=UPI001EF2B730|nr:hypothetical protein [Asanoa iriomotensis]